MRLALASVGLALLAAGGAAAKGPLAPDAYWFALDGPRIVFPRSAEVGKSCDVVVRDFRTGKDVVFAPDPATERACNGSPGGLLSQPVDEGRLLLIECPCLAIAGTRIAWVVELRDPGDDQVYHQILETATLAHPVGTVAATATYRLTGQYGLADFEGDRISGVVGDGSLLAYDLFSYANSAPTTAKLERVGGGVLASGLQATFAQSADRGHIALVRFDGSAGLYPGHSTIEPARDGVRSADVSGDLFGTIGKGNTLRLFTLGGRLLKKMHLAIGADRLRIDGERAVYSSRNEYVHLLDLRTGADRVVARAGYKGDNFGLRSLEFEAGRIVYSWGANLGWNTAVVRVG